MRPSPIVMYSTTWCGDCHRAKALLRSLDIAYTEIDIEATPSAAEIVAAQNNGRHVVPTFEIGDKHYGNPPLNELKTLLRGALVA